MACTYLRPSGDGVARLLAGEPNKKPKKELVGHSGG